MASVNYAMGCTIYVVCGLGLLLEVRIYIKNYNPCIIFKIFAVL